MSTWTEDRLEDFAAMLEEWPETLSTIGTVILTAPCIKTPDMKSRQMDQTGFQDTISATFDLLKSEFNRLALMPTSVKPRPRFTCNGAIWQIYRVGDDTDVDPIIQFWASKIQ